jgi:peptidoglycan/xylan/chitin deacetylase (PgdA/CDA1 family)
MQASGLVEVASHSYDLHRSVPINRQGNMAPAGRSWVYDRARGTSETDDVHRRRIRTDLIRSRDAIARETGLEPHVIIWPFGRYSGLALQEATAIGFDQMFTLEAAAADARRPFEIPRYYPTRDPDLGEMLQDLKFESSGFPVRAACVDLAPIAAARDPEEQDALLGRMIEDLRRLGPNIAIIDALRIGRDGKPIASRVPTQLLPIESDVLSRVARQLGTRAGVDVYVYLPLAMTVEAFGESAAIELVQQIVRGAPITGLALDGGGSTINPAMPKPTPAGIRAVRAAAGQASPLVMRIMRAAMVIDPQLRVIVVSNTEGVGPPDGADMILWPPALDMHDAVARAAELKKAGWFAPQTRGRILLGVPRSDPADQARSIRAMQAQGATAIALCPWIPRDTDSLGAVFSAATFPKRP